MIFLKNFKMPIKNVEDNYFLNFQLTCYNNFYPFKIFSNRILDPLEFSNITIFCGDNGSGKSTLLNVIAEKLNLNRGAVFNKSAFFEDYLKFCHYEVNPLFNEKLLNNSKIITSDDVFDFLLNLRYINEGVDIKRDELMEEYIKYKNKDFIFNSLDDYEEMKKVVNAKKYTKSKYVKNNTMKNIIGRSNGESAYMYFTENIKENGLYILDEPENSLSVNNQKKLAKYIEDSVRFYNCQFIISTHSPFILALDEARVYDLDKKPIEVVSWTEIENVKLYYEFFKNRKNEFK